MTTVNMDLDGVLCNFNEAMLRELPFENWSGMMTLGFRWEPSRWEWWDEVGMSRSEWNGWFYRAVRERGLWQNAAPYEGVAHEMWRLHDAGIFVRIVTTRLVHTGLHREAVTQTVEWLESHNIPYRALAFEGDKSVFAGPQRFLLDDNIDNVLAFNVASMHQGGFLLERPWNRDASPYQPHVSSLSEFVDRVIEELR